MLQGIGASKGIAIGEIKYLITSDLSVNKGTGHDPAIEKVRLTMAIAKAQKELDALYKKAAAVDPKTAEVFSVHKMMLEDPEFTDAMENELLEGCEAEWAVASVRDEYKAMFDTMEDEYMRARGADVLDISNRLLRLLKGVSERENLCDEPVILCAEDLLPSDTVKLKKESVLGFITKLGSSTSHSVILARTMGIPCIVGLGADFDKLPQRGSVAMDGDTGEIAVNPDKRALTDFHRRQEVYNASKAELSAFRYRKAVTAGGRNVLVCCNIGTPEDAKAVLETGADGVGLFRSEFIYLGRDGFPSEEEQFQSYKTVLETLSPRPVVIRTLDLGSDKQAPYFSIPQEANPALGYRAVRICLKQTDIFKTQLRALYRASAYGSLSIMIPMISHVSQLQKAKAIAEEVQRELEREGTPVREHVPLGIMVETPAAALLSAELAQEAEFFSIGTNDLTQYTLAVDRMNPAVNELFDSGNAAVLKLIAMTAASAHRRNIWVGICGESAANTALTDFYMACGIDELSVSPSAVLAVKKAVCMSKD